MFEVELKFPVHDRAALEERLRRAGFIPLATHVEIDHYYNAPDRDFAQTDEALRLRQVDGQTRVTYKGPKQGGRGKTRLEIELPLAAGTAASMHDLLLQLGYRPAAEVRKRRTHFVRSAADEAAPVPKLTLDEVDQVGIFVELEAQAEEADAGPCQEALWRWAKELHLEKEERRSYLELLLARQATGGLAPIS